MRRMVLNMRIPQAAFRLVVSGLKRFWKEALGFKGVCTRRPARRSTV